MLARNLRVIFIGLAVAERGVAAMAPSSASRANSSPSIMTIRQRNAGLRVAAGAAIGNLLQGFNTGIIAGALLYIVPEFDLATRPEITGLIASSTTMGAVLGTAASGRLSAETINGDVDIVLDDTPNVEVDAETFSGDIRNCMDAEVSRKSDYGPGRTLRLRPEETDRTVRVNTLNGDIDICTSD